MSATHRKARSRRRRWAGILLAALVLAPCRAPADVIYISVMGRTELAARPLVQMFPSADGKNQIILGKVVVLRDDNDQPVLPYGRRYFMFRPSKGAFTGTDILGNPDPKSTLVRLDWNWVGQMNREVSTLDDVRDIISNRDLRYRTGEEAMQALLADIDPLGEMHLKGAVPQPAYPNIVPREGSISGVLVHGRLTETDYQKQLASARALPSENPLSYFSLDPVFSRGPETDKALLLLRAAARCTRYGESEAGLRESCLAVLRFVCDRTYVEPADVPVGTRAKAEALKTVTMSCRRLVLNMLSNVGPQVISRAPNRPANVEGWPLEAGIDDPQPVSSLDLARVALEVLDSCRSPRVPDQGSFLDTVLLVAANRNDFRSVSKRPPLAQFTAGADLVGKQAFEVLQHLVTVPKDGSADTGASFRQHLRNKMLDRADPAICRAAREALAGAGVASEAEIAGALDYYVTTAVDWRGSDLQVVDDLAYVVRGLMASISDPALRAHYRDELGRRTAGLRDSVANGNRQSATVEFLQQLGATS